MKGLSSSAFVVGVAIAIGGASGCATAPSPTVPAVAEATTDSQGVQHAEIVAGSYWFRPQRVVVRANQPVELGVRKQGGVVPHSFVLKAPEAGIDVAVPLARERQVVEFTPTRPGTYSYYCDKSGLFGSHREKGMVGVLEVK